MNLKKNWKRFWTLSQSREGFTLVELIVVIAIMAILAGVAVPAYSGYIKKANKAADLQLLGAVNTAFGAACIENNTAPTSIANGGVTATISNGAVTGVSMFNDEFQKYYAGNTGSKFKVITQLVFEGGVFKDPADATNVASFQYGNNNLYISNETLAVLQNSTYSSIGGEDLLNEIGSLVDLVGGDDLDASSLLGNEDYLRSFASYIGVENADQLSGDALNAAIDNATADWDSDAASNAMINGLVYYAAENSSNMTVEGVTSLLNSSNIRNELSDDTGTMLAQASMVYGAYTGYVNSEYYKGSSSDVMSNPVDIVKTVGSDADFNAYVNSEQGQADLAAYIAAMGVINDSTGNAETVDVLQNGFTDNETLAGLLGDILGN